VGRKIIVVTAAYGADRIREAGGQRAILPVIAKAGADGVEIRRELFNDAELNALPTLARSIELLGLLVSLGHCRDKNQLEALRPLLQESGMTLVVENDQTDFGQLAPMQRFKAACRVQALPVSLTFDMGNWLWVGDSPEEAAQHLAPAVSYIHVKAAEPHQHHFRAVPPAAENCRWLALLDRLPADAPRGIEFPLEGPDLTAVTRHYVNLLREV